MRAAKVRPGARCVPLLAAGLLCLCGCDRPSQERGSATLAAPVGEAWFVDVSARAGINFQHQRNDEIRYWLPEIMSGGAAWLDYDNDADMDLYLVQGGSLVPTVADRPGNILYRNNGDGTFSNVTAASGTGDDGYGMGAAAGDYDHDGFVDIYVTNVGPNVLYRNNADGTFSNVAAETGTDDRGWSTSAGFIDFDRDGDLDLFVANYVVWSSNNEIVCFGGGNEQDYCHPNQYRAPAMDRLYRNEGDGRFSDVTVSARVSRAFGNGLGVAFGDFNNDHWMDIYVANDGMPNQLWMNRRDGTFGDEALITGAAMNLSGQAEAGMGVIAADVENDGDLDLFMTHLRGETNTLYVNANGLFQDATATRGLAAASLGYTGFGVGFADFDHDGLGDFFVANGRVGRAQAALVPDDSFAEPNQLFRGMGQGRFDEVRPVGGTDPVQIHNSRGAAFADYDNDGDIDALVINNGGPAKLLENVVGNQRHWVQFQIMHENRRPAIGAAIRIRAAGSPQWRQVQRAYSYVSSNEPRVHFGLGDAQKVEDVMVIWPNGQEEAFGEYPAGGEHVLVKGTGSAVPR